VPKACSLMRPLLSPEQMVPVFPFVRHRNKLSLRRQLPKYL
jgi:hypothetical protein